MMKKALLCVSLLILIVSIWSNEVQIGNELNFEKSVPLNPNFCYSMSQTIYHLYDTNIEDQLIQSLSFAYGNNNDWLVDNIRIYLGHTNKTVFQNNDDWIPIEELSLVFDGQVNFIQSLWGQIEFDTTFPYNNQDNLVVAIEAKSDELLHNNISFF